MVTSGTTSSTPLERSPGWATGSNTITVAADRDPAIATRSIACNADYRDPPAAKSLARSPFRVVHRWTEQGKPRSHVETITKLPAKYTIRNRLGAEDGLGGL